MDSKEHPSVSLFREYLRIKTVQPHPDYSSCMEFLKRMAKELDLPYRILELVPSKPLFIMTWIGKQTQLPSILLNSHTDVVPVFESFWNHDPFSAVKLENGDIVARGTQDMKCVGIQYLEAIRRLRNQGKQLERTIHVLFVPDEEIGGFDGMVKFVRTDDFKKLNIGMALDEGLANPNKNEYKLYYGERSPWWLSIKAKGNTGHGSQFIQSTAVSKLMKMINALLEFRDAEEHKLLNVTDSKGNPLTLGDVTTINLTLLKAGVQYNVIPEEAEAGFDIRITPKADFDQFVEWITGLAKKFEVDITNIQFYGKPKMSDMSPSNPFIQILEEESAKRNIKLAPEIFPAATDSRYIRNVGVPAYGISPIHDTPVLLHDHNEYLNENIFLEGIGWYTAVIERLGNLQ